MISVNDNGVLRVLDAIPVNDGGVLRPQQVINANKDGVLRPIFSAWKAPEELVWSTMTAGRNVKPSSNGYSVEFTSKIGIWSGKPAFSDVPAGHCCVCDDIYLKAGTKISAKRTAYSGDGGQHHTWLTIYNNYPEYSKRLSTSSTTAVTDLGAYIVPSDGNYRLGLYCEGVTYGQSTQYYAATASVEISITK